MTDKKCPRCGGPMGEVEAPMRETIRRMIEEQERKELARLKAKYE